MVITIYKKKTLCISCFYINNRNPSFISKVYYNNNEIQIKFLIVSFFIIKLKKV